MEEEPKASDRTNHLKSQGRAEDNQTSSDTAKHGDSVLVPLRFESGLLLQLRQSLVETWSLQNAGPMPHCCGLAPALHRGVMAPLLPPNFFQFLDMGVSFAQGVLTTCTRCDSEGVTDTPSALLPSTMQQGWG